ncbi:hypothetical protein KI387_008865, partial [Taxus chinensis]
MKSMATRYPIRLTVAVTAVSWAPALALGSTVGQASDPFQKLVSGGCDNTTK